ncbi:MAG: hypothetical protein NZ602_00805 [Thermoguttaceae bacterium]|nr:hypothetical protein [Thermoguttaceae bacterium]MDW8038098.1 hypothetical protein [Thermoguttaceae bacterium]
MGCSPLALRPVRRGYAEIKDNGGCLGELYAGLYAVEAFEDLIDFCLWET